MIAKEMIFPAVCSFNLPKFQHKNWPSQTNERWNHFYLYIRQGLTLFFYIWLQLQKSHSSVIPLDKLLIFILIFCFQDLHQSWLVIITWIVIIIYLSIFYFLSSTIWLSLWTYSSIPLKHWQFWKLPIQKFANFNL